MATVINAEQMPDLLRTTLPELGELRFTDLQLDQQRLVAFPNLLKKNRVSLESGSFIQFNVLVDHNHAATNVAPYQSDTSNTNDGNIQGNFNLRRSQTSYSLDRVIMMQNRSPRRIIDLWRQERTRGLTALALLFEGNWWNLPAASDPTTPLGVPYWLPRGTVGAEGFTTALPTNYTSVANIVPATYPRWGSWWASYNAIAPDDFVRHARTASVKTHFKPPVDNTPTFNTGDSYGYYAPYNLIQQLEDIVTGQNEDLGGDIAWSDGRTLFHRTPVTYVPWLDNDPAVPFYGLNWGEFKTFILRDAWLMETFIPHKPGEHMTMVQFIDCVYAFGTRDRRRHFVLAQNNTYPS